MNEIRLILVLLFAPTLILPTASHAFNPYPKTAGDVYVKMPNVSKVGTLYVRLLGNPKVLNPILNNDFEPYAVIGNIYCRLMEQDHETGDYFPLLAESLDVSKDRKTMTYTLRKEATWEDGTPVTTDDVEFSYNMLWDPKVQAAPMRAYMGPFKFEKVDQLKFRFIVEKPGINTLTSIQADFRIFQKKQFAGVTDFNTAKQIMSPIGDGPYRLKNFSRDQKLELELKKDWWGFKVPAMKNLYNFDSIVYRIIPDTTLSYEKFMKGELDVIEMNAEMYGTRVKGSDQEKFGKSPDTNKPVWAQHFRTDAPAQWTYLGWNLKNPMFASKKTRLALAMLIDYDQIIDKVYYGEAIRSASPFGTNSMNSTPEQRKKVFKYDPKKALALLKEDGWEDSDHDNVLDKVIDGKKVNLEFTARYNSENPMRAKVAQIVKENFKKAGIIVNIQAMEWNSFVTEYKAHRFEAIISGWAGGNLMQEPNQIWHSKSYENNGSNFVGYSNPEVDKLIEQSRDVLDKAKYLKLIQKIGALIYDDQPYAFIMELPGFIIGGNNRTKANKWALKYDNYPPLYQYYAAP